MGVRICLTSGHKRDTMLGMNTILDTVSHCLNIAGLILVFGGLVIVFGIAAVAILFSGRNE